MEEKHRVCKICNRRFANGKAMGGHMRSHFAKLPIPPKLTLPSSSSTPPPTNNIIKSSPSSSVLFSEINHMQQPYGSVNELSSETQFSIRRSKRLCNSSPSDSVSSVILPIHDEIICSEDAAKCLLVLSRDKWPLKEVQKAEFLDDGGWDMDLDDDEDNPRTKYKCKTCDKSFKSPQALGGHKASHKNNRAFTVEERKEDKGKESGGDYQIHQQRIFECPFCDKVFQSGQALGGHKKVHFSYLSVAHSKMSKTSSSTVQLFDLNLPASEDDDDHDDHDVVILVENSMASANGEM